jgi:hypothetical protein
MKSNLLAEDAIMQTGSRLHLRSKKGESLLAGRPAIYICVILAAVLVAFTYKLRTDTIFACQADGYSSDRYIAYCNGAGYADYEHGAFWFGLEPVAQDFARNADVLFLGSSRLQVALSTAATANWFSAASARYYLLGFSYNGNVLLADEILRRISPRARVYVINVDDFFERSESAPMKTILHDPNARNRYEVKRLWQHIHEPICKTFAALCRSDYVIFRSRETGAYTKRTGEQKIVPVSYDEVVNRNLVDSDTAAAIDFLPHLHLEQKCIILTNIPTVETKIGNAKAIAKALGIELVTPEIGTELRTYDGSHLDQPSAEQWSQAFFQAASSRIRSCLDE